MKKEKEKNKEYTFDYSAKEVGKNIVITIELGGNVSCLD
jgi:hypothetical protein